MIARVDCLRSKPWQSLIDYDQSKVSPVGVLADLQHYATISLGNTLLEEYCWLNITLHDKKVALASIRLARLQ